MREDVEKILISEEELKKRIKELAAQLNIDYKGKVPIVVSVLKGAYIFMADIVREFDFQCKMDFMSVSSYPGKNTESQGTVRIIKDMQIDIRGEDVLIIEDIIDSGRTLKALVELLGSRNPKSIKICTLLDKPERRKVEMSADYVGFEIGDEFVIGYGFDFDDKYRQLPFIGVPKPELYI